MSSSHNPKRFLSKNGQEYWLMKNRADERHRQHRRTLPRTATVWDYAPLLDIVCHSPDGKGYRFLNRNVTEWLRSLHADPEVYARANTWLECLGPDICTAMADHPRAPNSFYAHELARIPWISLLDDSIRSLDLKRASTQQWANTVQSLTAKGIKPEEIEQSGLLYGVMARRHATASITRKEVISALQLDHAKPRLVVEAVSDFASRGGWAECCQRLPQKVFKQLRLPGQNQGSNYLIRYRHRSFGWIIVRARIPDLFIKNNEWWLVLDDKGKLVIDAAKRFDFDSPQKAIERAEQVMASKESIFKKSRALHRWEKYSLSGAESYQEVLLQLEDWPADYRSQHYATRNVLIHVRMSYRTLQDGRRVLYLDEIQSDWHADLSDQAKSIEQSSPSHNVIPVALFRNEWPLLALKVMLWWAQRQKMEGVAFSNSEIQHLRWSRPPSILYSKLLPKAAQQLAAALSLPDGTADIKIFPSNWKVENRGAQWVVCNEAGIPYTKPFSTRAQAEKFCSLCCTRHYVSTPVIWLDGLPQITGIPLYGLGVREQWLRVRSKSALK